MYADVNRNNLDPETTHFSRLLHLQGRVMLPSDMNETGAILQYYLRQFIIDFVGRRWRTSGSFKINAFDKKNFMISKGHFYVDGILCVNEADCWYSSDNDHTPVQPMFPTPELAEISGDFPQTFAIYLECWERHVNSIQWPALTEAALGGADTSSRLQIAWQVRILTKNLAISYVDSIINANKKPHSTSDCQDIESRLKAFFRAVDENTPDPNACDDIQGLIDYIDCAEPKLRVWAKNSTDSNQPCSISPDAQYNGLENQLYRVEIHNPGVVPDSGQQPLLPPSFKWSRENGSVVFRIIPKSLSTSSDTITLDVETIRPDRRYGLCVNDWVELTSDEIEFGQKVLPLVKVVKIDSNLGRLTLSIPPLKTGTEFIVNEFTMLRRWDQSLSSNTINELGTLDIREGYEDDYDKADWILLEHGIKIQFQPGGNYHKGDYWLIPARVETGDVEWPKKINSTGKKVPDLRPTDGVKRHRAALGVVIAGTVTEPGCSCTVDPYCEKKT